MQRVLKVSVQDIVELGGKMLMPRTQFLCLASLAAIAAAQKIEVDAGTGDQLKPLTNFRQQHRRTVRHCCVQSLKLHNWACLEVDGSGASVVVKGDEGIAFAWSCRLWSMFVNSRVIELAWFAMSIVV